MAEIIDNHTSSRRWHPRSDHSRGNSGAKVIENYGVWKSTPTWYEKGQLFTSKETSPHLYLHFDDGSGDDKSAAINVASTDSDHRLVYWLQRNFSHPLTDSLASLDSGFTQAQSQDGKGTDFSLDFLRTSPPLMQLSAGEIVQDNDLNESNSILSQLEPILDDAIHNGADMYIFGSSYNTGIHDIHMNQGSAPSFANSVGCDGAIIFHFPSDGHYEAVFLAFASQRTPTDDVRGTYLDDSTPLSELIQGGQGGQNDSSDSSDQES